VKFGIRNLHIMLLRRGECREKWHKGDLKFIVAYVKLHFPVHLESLRHFENGDFLGKVCVPCQGAQHLQPCL
jgi:hypothetical protein